MPCETVQIEGTTAILCRRGRRGPRCFYKCRRASEFQCDFPVLLRDRKPVATCDRHLCAEHVRHGVTKGIDFCMEHYPTAKAAYERRKQIL